MTLRTPRLLASALALALAACAATAPGDGGRPAGVRMATPPTATAPAARPASPQPRVETGTLDGAAFRIDIPANWNGELVVHAHGYETVGSARPDPLPFPPGMEPLLARGFAIAASGYSRQGWAVGEGIADTERLRAHFVARHGAPKRSWVVGWSMGGLIALASAERHPHAYDGVVAMCGVTLPAGTMMAQGALGPVAAFDAAFPGVLPQAPGGLADPSLASEPDGEAILAALARDPARAAQLAARFDIPVDAFGGSVWLYYVALRELAHRSGGFPVSSLPGADGVDGDEAALGLRIRRYVADPDAAAAVQAAGGLTGRAPVPVVLQPNATDPIVPARFSHGYARLAEAAGHGAQVRVLPPQGDGHCRFAADTVSHALDAVRMR